MGRNVWVTTISLVPVALGMDGEGLGCLWVLNAFSAFVFFSLPGDALGFGWVLTRFTLKRIYCLGTLILTWNMVIENTTYVEKRTVNESASFGVFEKIRIWVVTRNLYMES